MLVEGTNKKIHNIDSNVGVVVGGRLPDGKNIVSRAR